MKMNASTIISGICYIRRFGLRTLLIRIIEKREVNRKSCLQAAASQEQLAEQRKHAENWGKTVKISIVTPLYNTPEIFLRDMIESVMASSYENWQLCLADATGGSAGILIEGIVKEYQMREEKLTGQASRICYKKVGKNYGIAENTNYAISMAEGDYIAFLDHDDVITPDALYEMASAARSVSQGGQEASMFYSDEDKVNEDRTCYFEPHYKPDYNPDLLNSNNYITHFLMVSRALLKLVGGIDKVYDGAQDYDFILRCTEHADKVVHVPKILYHWRVHDRSTAGGAGSKDYAIDAGKRAIEAHLQREGISAKVVITPYFGFYRIEYERNKADSIDDYVLFVERSLRPLNPEWKELLYAACSQRNIGVVGGKIYDRHRRVQEAAFFLQDTKKGKVETNMFFGLKDGYGGYMHRANIQMNCDRVSEKCMLVRKEILNELGVGEHQIVNSEFARLVCDKAGKMGYRILYEPDAKMIFKS